MAGKGLKVYVDLRSTVCRSIVGFADLAKLDYEQVFVDLSVYENKTDWFAKLNPVQMLPVIDDHGFLLNESVSIIQYLA
jgi:glutathione S-transferase